jgi:hypothetical protein
MEDLMVECQGKNSNVLEKAREDMMEKKVTIGEWKMWHREFLK